MEIKNQVVKIMMTVLCLLTLVTSGLLFAEERHQLEDTIFAEYRGGRITRADFDEEFQKIPLMYRSRFSNLAGQKELLNSIIISNLFYMKAQDLGVNQREDVKKAVEEGLREYYAMEFRQRDISDKVIIPQDEIRSHYDQNIDRFTESANTIIHYIMPEDNEQATLTKNALADGMDFIDVMNLYSTNSFSKRHQGVIRNIRGNGYIAGVGMDDTLDEAITNAPLNTWMGPLTTETGIHIFMVTERTPKRIKPLDEVRDEVISRLKPAEEIEMTENVYNQLKDKYGVQIHFDLLEGVNLMDPRTDPNKAQEMLVTANNPDLQMSIGGFLNHFRRFSQQEIAQVNNPQYRNETINNVVRTSLFAYEARMKGYSESMQNYPEAEQIRRNIVLTHLFNDLVVSQATPTRTDVEGHYQENLERYSVKESRTIQFFLFDNNRSARRARSNAVRAYRANNEEEISEIISGSLFTDNNGLIANIQRDPNIPRIGQDEQVFQTIWATKTNELSSIKRTADGNFFFVKVLDEIPARVIPLNEAEERITMQLTRELRERRWGELQEQLKEEYNLVTYMDRLAMMYSARELFDLAEESMKRNRHREAIQYYDQIVENYKNNDDDYKALFMKAFVMAEEMQNPQEAVKIFQSVIDNYPQGELHESAEYMIKSIEEGFDVFEDLK